MPEGASFCPRCGAPADAVPVLPLVGEGPGDAEPLDDGPPRSGRTLLGLAVAVVLVLVVLSTLSSGDDGQSGEPEESASTTSTTRPRTSTTQRPTTTAVPGTPGQLLAPDAVLPLGVELLAIADARDGALVVADLGTGLQVEIPEPPTPIRNVVWTGDVVLAQTADGIVRLAGDGSAPWLPVDVGDARVGWLDWNGLVIFESAESPWGEPTVVGADGTVRTWTLPANIGMQLMRSGGARGLLGDAVLLETSDGIYTVGLDGAIDRLSYGRVVGIGRDRVLVQRCDENLRCELVVADTGGGVRRLPDLGTDVEVWVGGVSPDGRTAWVGGGSPFGGGGATEGIWMLSGDEWIPIGGEGTGFGQGYPYGAPPTWSSDSTRVAWWDMVRSVVHVADARDPAAAPVEVQVDRGVADSSDMGEVVVLVPRDAVPEALRPPR